MAILFCGRCGCFREIGSEYTGKSVICPRCRQAARAQDTLELLKNIIQKYQQTTRELKQLKEQVSSQGLHAASEPPSRSKPQPAAECQDSTGVDRWLLSDVDIHDTTSLADPRQYASIAEWMEKRRIRLDVDHQAIDTTGFFDEVAVRMGEDYDTLKPVIDRLRHNHQRGYANIKLSLSKHSPEQAETIKGFCRELHDYSLVSKLFHNRKEQTVHMVIQQAPVVSRFFIGEWMEWFVFMKILNAFREQGTPVACLRSFHVNFPNGDKHEIDGFFLVGNEALPLCVECKSGEFRQDIGKFSLLRRKLGLDRTQFLVCAIGLNDTQIRAFNSMYDVTFANESNFLQHVIGMVRPRGGG